MQNRVLEFWFQELSPKQWWQVDPQLDQTIFKRFGEVHRAASQCELFEWRDSAHGRLAEIIVLDQFSRNIFRNQANAFQQDSLALALAQEAVAQGALTQLNDSERPFLLMPYMHSESAVIHTLAIDLFKRWADKNYDFELRHKAIIDRFGRYPHRNVILGRESNAEEVEFLTQPGSSF